MIQLSKAQFTNFRLLRDVSMVFATKTDKPLTVIRGENDSGKTTLLNAVSWALFGDDALPARRSAYRLHPINWSIEAEGEDVAISVVLDFVARDDQTGEEQRYTLERSTTEKLNRTGEFIAQAAALTLRKHTSHGTLRVENPSALINSLIPPALRGVFLIDGDRALGFIEALDQRSVKRERVESAIRSLLGLTILENAEKHVTQARREAVQATKREASGTDLGALSARVGEIEQQVLTAVGKREQLHSDRDATEGRRRKADERLKEALAAGGLDRKALAADLSQTEIRAKRAGDHLDELLAAQQNLLSSSTLAVAVAAPRLAEAAALLSDLENRKVIPDTLPSVIRDRLEKGTCICGADLAPGTAQNARLTTMLVEAEEGDWEKELLGYLNDGVRRLLRDVNRQDTSWSKLAIGNLGSIKQVREGIESDNKTIGELRTRIGLIPDTNIAELEKMLAEEDIEARRVRDAIADHDRTLGRLEASLSAVKEQRADALRKQGRYHQRYCEELAASDIVEVIQDAIGVLQTETLAEVSAQMNEIFMNMIVAGDLEDRAIIRSVELTRAYDILVHGPDSRDLDPDRDLNGASRRALTLAFILALVKVSGVTAPLIVDTPLGMTSGPVRQAMVTNAVANASQLILFLTRDEIHNVEAIIDKYAGSICTITNTAHYPSKLANRPANERIETIACTCDHKRDCRTCQRRTA